MPIKLIDNSPSLGILSVLDKVEFFNTEEGKYFKLSDSTGSEIRVEYIPSFISDWTVDRYEILLFENPYLTAENDIFQVYESTLGDSRLGWIFPVTSLDSNENDYAEDKYFKHYRYVAYWKLLSLEYLLKYQEAKQEYRLSEIFPNLSVFIISKEEIAKIPDFKIENYLLSLLKLDYLLFRGAIKGKSVFDKTQAIEALRKGNHRFTIKKSAFDITDNQYTNSLFLEHLYQSENFLVKYILLYQILEHFIQEIADVKLDELIKSYQDGAISKHSLRQGISRFSNDGTLVKKVFERTTIGRETKKNFNDKCSFLFKDIGENLEGDFVDVLYGLRNLVTHRYRTISEKTDDLKEITRLFETIIIELLINFNDKDKIEEEECLKVKVSQSIDSSLFNESISLRIKRGWREFLYGCRKGALKG